MVHVLRPLSNKTKIQHSSNTCLMVHVRSWKCFIQQYLMEFLVLGSIILVKEIQQLEEVHLLDKGHMKHKIEMKLQMHFRL